MNAKIITLFEMCLNKDLTFNYAAQVNSVTIWDPQNMGAFHNYSYIDFEPNIKTESMLSIDDLIEKVKNYKK